MGALRQLAVGPGATSLPKRHRFWRSSYPRRKHASHQLLGGGWQNYSGIRQHATGFWRDERIGSDPLLRRDYNLLEQLPVLGQHLAQAHLADQAGILIETHLDAFTDFPNIGR